MDVVRRLCGTPQSYFVVSVEVGDCGVLLEGKMRVAFVKERVLAHKIGFGKASIDIAELKRDLFVDVAAIAVVMNPWLFNQQRFVDS